MRHRSLLSRGATLLGLTSLAGCTSSVGSEPSTTTNQPVDTDPGTTPPSPSEPDDGAVIPLSVSTATVELADDYATTVQFTVRNDTDEKLRFNPFMWNLWSWIGDDWYQWEQKSAGNGFVDVEPGESASWSLTEVVDYIGYEPLTRPGWYAVQLRSRPTRPVEFRLVES